MLMKKQSTPSPQRRPDLEASWLAVLESEFSKEYMDKLRKFLAEEKRLYDVYPPGNEMFNAFALTPFTRVKVVILGQDPYHGPGQAHGLCFSVPRGVRPPPSLKNIFRELSTDLGVVDRGHGDLSSWARQGVLLLNTVLSVRRHEAHSHRKRGWEKFTDRVICELNENQRGLAFVLWGAAAGRKAEMIDSNRHAVFKSPHPSPLSAYKGFFGCRHFSKINRFLVERGDAEINWQLPD